MIVFIDVETTGLPDKHPYPVEVLSMTAIAKCNTKIICKSSRYYYSRNYDQADHRALEINGLTAKNVSELRHHQQTQDFYTDDYNFWTRLLTFFSDKGKIQIAAYNIDFDFQFLPEKIKQIAEPICIMKMAHEYLGHTKDDGWLSLKKACQRLYIDFDEDKAHNSEYDTLKAMELYEYMINNPKP